MPYDTKAAKGVGMRMVYLWKCRVDVGLDMKVVDRGNDGFVGGREG